MIEPTEIIIFHAARIILQLRGLSAHELGTRSLTDAARSAVLALDDFEVERGAAMRPAFEVGRRRGRHVIRLRSGLGPHAEDFGCTHLIARRHAGAIDFLRDVCDVVGWATVLPSEVLADPLNIARVKWQVRAMDPAWYDARAERLFPLAAAVRREVESYGPGTRGEWLKDLAGERITAARALKEAQRYRDANKHAEAEHWFLRALAMSDASTPPRVVMYARFGLGGITRERRDLAMARLHFLCAYCVARRIGAKAEQGFACHDMVAVATLQRKPAKARRYLRRAVRHFAGKQDQILRLSCDVVAKWLEEDQPAEAAPVLRALLDTGALSPAVELGAHANLSFACALLGIDREYVRAWDDAVGILAAPPPNAPIASVLLVLAEAAMSAHDWDRADQALGWLRDRTSPGEPIHATATDLLHQVCRRRVEPPERRVYAGVWNADTPVASELVRALRALRVTTGANDE